MTVTSVDILTLVEVKSDEAMGRCGGVGVGFVVCFHRTANPN
jgi:hypothetical protein